MENELNKQYTEPQKKELIINYSEENLHTVDILKIKLSYLIRLLVIKPLVHISDQKLNTMKMMKEVLHIF